MRRPQITFNDSLIGRFHPLDNFVGRGAVVENGGFPVGAESEGDFGAVVAVVAGGVAAEVDGEEGEHESDGDLEN